MALTQSLVLVIGRDWRARWWYIGVAVVTGEVLCGQHVPQIHGALVGDDHTPYIAGPPGLGVLQVPEGNSTVEWREDQVREQALDAAWWGVLGVVLEVEKDWS